MVLCNANAIIEYNIRRSGLPRAPLDMEYDNDSIEQTKIQSFKNTPKYSLFQYSHIHVQIKLFIQRNLGLLSGIFLRLFDSPDLGFCRYRVGRGYCC